MIKIKPSYDTYLNFLRDWIRDINKILMNTGKPPMVNPNNCSQVKSAIQQVANGVINEYSFLSSELKVIQNNLFNYNLNPPILNSAAFGELYLAIEQIINEPLNIRI